LHENVYSIDFYKIFLSLYPQVWFQNRRMKDKRQRIAVAWPYAAVYSDPAFAASILQAAATSVALPYAYPGLTHPGPPLLPHNASSAAHFSNAQLLNPAGNLLHPAANHFNPYYARYAPYPIPANTALSQNQSSPQSPNSLRSSSAYSSNLLHQINMTHQALNPMSQGPYMSPLSLGRGQKEAEVPRSSISPNRVKNNMSPCHSDISVNSNLSLSPVSHAGETSPTKPHVEKILNQLNHNRPYHQQYSEVLRHHQNLDGYSDFEHSGERKIETQTRVAPEKPKLFKPYKSEA
jgi:hypothetical protein